MDPPSTISGLATKRWSPARSVPRGRARSGARRGSGCEQFGEVDVEGVAGHAFAPGGGVCGVGVDAVGWVGYGGELWLSVFVGWSSAGAVGGVGGAETSAVAVGEREALVTVGGDVPVASGGVLGGGGRTGRRSCRDLMVRCRWSIRGRGGCRCSGCGCSRGTRIRRCRRCGSGSLGVGVGSRGGARVPSTALRRCGARGVAACCRRGSRRARRR